MLGSCAIDFPPQQCERVVHAYVGMYTTFVVSVGSLRSTPESLERHRLGIPAAYIRRYAGIPSLELATEEITQQIRCGRCRKLTGSLEDTGSGKKFWWCKRCQMPARVCEIW